MPASASEANQIHTDIQHVLYAQEKYPGEIRSEGQVCNRDRREDQDRTQDCAEAPQGRLLCDRHHPVCCERVEGFLGAARF